MKNSIINIRDLARETNISYFRLYPCFKHESAHGLKDDEIKRVVEALKKSSLEVETFLLK